MEREDARLFYFKVRSALKGSDKWGWTLEKSERNWKEKERQEGQEGDK